MKSIEKFLIAGTEFYLLNCLLKEKFISEEEYEEIKKYITI